MNKWILIAALVSQVALATQVEDLSNVANEISGDAVNATTLDGKYQMTNAGKCALLIMGTSSSSSVPVYFIPGPVAVSALQADAIVGPGITVTGITAGPEAINSGKSVQAAPVPGGERFILVGFNQNGIGAGNVANISFDLAGASIGPHVLTLTNFVASDANGKNVPLCVTTGVITK